jgi:quinol monooxygenase YgiN
MLARRTSVKVAPDTLEELTHLLEPGLADVKASPGFQSALFLADRATGKATMVTVWETEAARQASLSLRQEALAQVAPLLVGAVSTETYEVLAQG